MKITIVYNNTSTSKELKTNCDFACVIEAYGQKILFDTSTFGKTLLYKLVKLKIDINTIDKIFISHKY